MSKTSMVDSRNSANITLNEVIVSLDDVLSEENNGAALLEAVLDRAHIAISAEMLGNASQAFDITLEYLKERKQFGAVASPSPRRTTRLNASMTVKFSPEGRAISRRQLLVPRSSAA